MNFQPGDAVVCIDVISPCCGDETLSGGGLPQPVIRRTYRVGAVNKGQCNKCGEILMCMNPVGFETETWAWPQLLFRKIEPATESIFKRESVDA